MPITAYRNQGTQYDNLLIGFYRTYFIQIEMYILVIFYCALTFVSYLTTKFVIY